MQKGYWGDEKVQDITKDVDMVDMGSRAKNWTTMIQNACQRVKKEKMGMKSVETIIDSFIKTNVPEPNQDKAR